MAPLESYIAPAAWATLMTSFWFAPALWVSVVAPLGWVLLPPPPVELMVETPRVGTGLGPRLISALRPLRLG